MHNEFHKDFLLRADISFKEKIFYKQGVTMVSGKYSALAGALSRQQSISVLSNNVANVNTTGFKQDRVSFESMLENKLQLNQSKGINYSRLNESVTDFTQGSFKDTENPLDLAIQGDAYFQIQGQDGPLYTRRGDFGLLQDGTLATRHGLPVLGEGGAPVNIPDADISDIAFADDGTIYILGDEGRREEVGKVGLFEIDDQTLLTHVSDTTFTLEEGATATLSDTGQVLQGKLEVSNVNMIKAMATLIDNQRAFDTLHKAIKSYSTISEENEKLGRLG